MDATAATYETIVTCLNAIFMTTIALASFAWRAASTTVTPQRAATCTALIPCFLPNEQDIILDTLARLCRCDALERIILVYNTTHALPTLEFELDNLARDHHRLFILRATRSRSKAQNLNEAIPYVTTDAVLLLDADHHIDDDNVRRLVDFFARARADDPRIVGVQTPVLVRGREGLSRVLNGLAWYYMCILQPALRVLSGSAVFVGGGAIFATSHVKALAFRAHMIAEDDDFTMRTVESGKRIEICLSSTTSELAPVSVGALIRQRLRWTVGYEQSFNHHVRSLCCRIPRMLAHRIYPWLCYALVINGAVQGVLSARYGGQDVARIAAQLSIVGVPVVALMLVVILRHRRLRTAPTLDVAVAFPLLWPYGIAQTLLFCYARVRLLFPYKWNVTRRRALPCVAISPRSATTSSTI